MDSGRHLQNKKISISNFNHCQDNKMMFTGLAVLSVVLVCSNVFSGCVAQDRDTLPEEFETLPEESETLPEESMCQRILDYVKQKEPCIPDVEHFLEYYCLVHCSCEDETDVMTVREIERVVFYRACDPLYKILRVCPI